MNNSSNSFFSMDRLIEFGMGMAMSQQIAKTMNNMMNSMQQPPLVTPVHQAMAPQYAVGTIAPPVPNYQQQGSWKSENQQVSQNPASFSSVANNTENQKSVPPVLPDVYYISDEKGEVTGPYCGIEMARMVNHKQITAETLVWKTGLQKWVKAYEIQDLVLLIALVPPSLQ